MSRRRHNPRTCGGKRRYRDHAEALHAMRTLQARSAREKVPVRVYLCPDCAGYHLTSKPNRRPRRWT